LFLSRLLIDRPFFAHGLFHGRRGTEVLLAFNVFSEEVRGATPHSPKEAAQLLFAEGTFGEQLIADGRVAGLCADVRGVDEGGVVGGHGLSVVGEHVDDEVLLWAEAGGTPRLEVAEHLEDAAVGVELPHGGQEHVLAFIGVLFGVGVDGTAVAIVSSPAITSEISRTAVIVPPVVSPVTPYRVIDQRRALQNRQATHYATNGQRGFAGHNGPRHQQDRQREVS